MRRLYWAGIAIALVAIAGYFYVQHRLSSPVMSDEAIAQLKSDVAAQDENAFATPTPQAASYQVANPLKNVYFGDLHSHSNLSFDSYIFGNRLTVDQAYRFAKGEVQSNPSGEMMQLSIPLDFAAVTDHAEGFGMRELCADTERSSAASEFCNRLESPSASFFLELRRQGEDRPPKSDFPALVSDPAQIRQFASSTWAQIVSIADRHNEPGKFTTFAAYEYSPPLPETGKIHRNVIFRGNDVPSRAVSAFDAATELDLWEQLIRDCQAPCEFLTIPHNPNKSWGLAFASQTIDGDAYDAEDWKRRSDVEPIVEMFQIKGNSECAIGFGTTDEECRFEQFLPRCESGQETGCVHSTSMARDGLKKGLLLEEEIGTNPLRFGMIGSTDGHNSNPGDAEEYDYRGAAGLFTGSAKRRLAAGVNEDYGQLIRNPGGLAAIWAEENTRDALFTAMQRKEVYATSGTRIRLRFFAGFDYPEAIVEARDGVRTAYNRGVPMGGVLDAGAGSVPAFFIWAVRDPLDAPLDKIQIIKGWVEDGKAMEEVRDIICSDNRTVDPQTGRCPATDAKVSLENCAFSQDTGATELKTLWRDQNYRPDQNAFYYVRVIQNPTCRWSTYDSLRLGRKPPSNAPATVTEMAWSSPIWVGR